MYEKAIEACKQAISIELDDADAHYNLACSYSLLGSVNKALESLGKAIDLGYNDIKHLENDSDLDGLRDEAGYEMLINKLKRQESSDVEEEIEAYKQAASDVEEEIASYKQAIRIDPDYAVAHYGLGYAYILLNDRGSAIEQYKILESLDSELANKLFNFMYK